MVIFIFFLFLGFSFFLAFEGFVYLFFLTFFCALRLPVAVAFFTQSTVNFFFGFFWSFNSGNFLNAPSCVGVGR